MTGRDAVRDAVLDDLAFVIHAQGYCGEVCVCTDDARALLPVVDRIANQRAAAELRKAADWIWDDVPARASASAELHARGDALDPS